MNTSNDDLKLLEKLTFSEGKKTRKRNPFMEASNPFEFEIKKNSMQIKLKESENPFLNNPFENLNPNGRNANKDLITMNGFSFYSPIFEKKKKIKIEEKSSEEMERNQLEYEDEMCYLFSQFSSESDCNKQNQYSSQPYLF